VGSQLARSRPFTKKIVPTASRARPAPAGSGLPAARAAAADRGTAGDYAACLLRGANAPALRGGPDPHYLTF
jgi:hypothetical protein